MTQIYKVAFLHYHDYRAGRSDDPTYANPPTIFTNKKEALEYMYNEIVELFEEELSEMEIYDLYDIKTNIRKYFEEVPENSLTDTDHIIKLQDIYKKDINAFQEIRDVLFKGEYHKVKIDWVFSSEII